MTLMIRIVKPSCAHRTITAKQARSSWRPFEAENQGAATAGEMPRLDAFLSGNTGPSLSAHARLMQNNWWKPECGRHAPPVRERLSARFRNRPGLETSFRLKNAKKSEGRG